MRINNEEMKKNELLDENLILRKKVEMLTTKNRSLEILNDDLESENLLDRIESIYGKTVKESTIPISYKKDSYQINGFIGNLSLVKSTRNYQYLFINGRHIKNQ